jgi:LacI family transcriptional regulator
LGEDVAGGTRDRYRRYAERKGLAWHSFATEHDPPFIHDLRRMDRVDPELARWLSSLRRPAGIFSQNSLAGPYLCRVCAALEIDVPGEIGVVGADSTDVALACQPPLSSIRVPAETIGYMAAKLVVDMLEGRSPPTEPVIVPGSKLIGRASTGALPQAGCDVDMALTFITNHACEGVTVNDLVMQTQEVSRMTFHKRFCEATGMTPGKALQERRLSEARRLLAETVFSISAVAGMCGYANDLYFSQVFRRSEGVAPRTYRRLHQRR